ncbi:rhamnogalacturonan acetylesterase [Pelomonas sp. SE-A7]|uniref:rhamnogalacturonan acetylesterase n=1 Tax=Pelomonas sp. SE-A7 TaxID=3054953 RepID=UPI00259CD79F|nr:rhamnogalacturonan acetylesterase [Pelomonas sp. SE-A7]MDM4765267.1 rhamnogalacturonan acetylesterase [Pelomonas sp. SE-A7]
MKRFLAPLLALLPLLGAVAQPLPAAVNTDPRTAQVNLPEPARADLPTLFFIGDSTVRNGKDDGQGLGPVGQWGWGNPIAALFDANRINVVNRAIGGLSSRTYITGGHWERSKAFIKRGDTVLIQFGHNDATAINDNTRARGTIKGTGEESQEIDNLMTGQKEVVFSYGAYLRRYVGEIRALGATPVLCSPVPRKRWDEQGRIARAADSYGGWAAEVARQQKVGFIDLNELVARRYDELGREAVMKLFPQVTPEEHTHTNWAGAQATAEIVARELRNQKLLDPRFFVAKDDDRPVVDASKLARDEVRDAQLPTLFIIGDSTVRSAGQGGAWGWGEKIAAFFDEKKLNVVNRAIGGRSSRTFLTEGRWEAVAAQLKAGDHVLIQFGHNDGGRIGDPAMKGRASGAGIGPEVVEDLKPDGSREQVHTFGWYLARYIADAKARGATPIVLSPIPHKDRWQEGRDFENFAAWGAQVAKEAGVPFIDLTMLVTEGYRRLGADQVAGFFSDARTHTNDAGARFNAERVVDGLRQLPGAPFAGWLRP